MCVRHIYHCLYKFLCLSVSVSVSVSVSDSSLSLSLSLARSPSISLHLCLCTCMLALTSWPMIAGDESHHSHPRTHDMSAKSSCCSTMSAAAAAGAIAAEVARAVEVAVAVVAEAAAVVAVVRAEEEVVAAKEAVARETVVKLQYVMRGWTSSGCCARTSSDCSAEMRAREMVLEASSQAAVTLQCVVRGWSARMRARELVLENFARATPDRVVRLCKSVHTRTLEQQEQHQRQERRWQRRSAAVQQQKHTQGQDCAHDDVWSEVEFAAHGTDSPAAVWAATAAAALARAEAEAAAAAAALMQERAQGSTIASHASHSEMQSLTENSPETEGGTQIRRETDAERNATINDARGATRAVQTEASATATPLGEEAGTARSPHSATSVSAAASAHNAKHTQAPADTPASCSKSAVSQSSGTMNIYM